MPYTMPQDPRKPWYWCPKCEAWYEVDSSEWARLPLMQPGQCFHPDYETRLDPADVELLSRTAKHQLHAMGEYGA